MRQINKVAVLGAGVMGAAIAAHLANAGIEVLLLDLVPPDAPPRGEGADRERSRIATNALSALASAKPAPLYAPAYAEYIHPGNFEDDAARLKECDWVIEVVLENLEVKLKLFAELVVPNLKPDAVLSTNTSGLSVNELARALPEEVRRRFMVTHFFNPPRYMRLMEMVPCAETDPKVLAAMAQFLGKRLGKGVVYGKDTPNFIANRIGTYAGSAAWRHMTSMGLTVEEVDAVTGPALARPKTGTFALWDLVGIDTVVRVLDNSYALLSGDDERELLRVPEEIRRMVADGLTGKKGKGGFYRRETVEGESVKVCYDYHSGSYNPCVRPKFASVAAAKQIDDPAQRVRTLLSGGDRAAQFAWLTLRDTLIYVVKRLAEIADDVVNVDNAMKWGYNWELGPFELLDALGVAEFVSRCERDGVALPDWLKEVQSFYRVEGGKKFQYLPEKHDFAEIPRPEGSVSLTLLNSAGGEVERNSAASLIDIGDGVFCLEFHSKLNTMGGETLAMIQKGIRRAEADGVGMVIANEGGAFSAGANLMLVAMAIAEGAWDDLALTVKAFQKAMMSIKYSKVPVVAAPHGLAMGGACETCLHADAINAHAETYMGLVEIGVGLIPAGGGTKEMAIRAVRLAEENGADVQPFLFRNYQNIAMGKVSSSAAELLTLGLMRQGDGITLDLDRRIHDAKLKAIALAANYRPGRPSTGIKAPGKSVASSIKVQLWNLERGGFISSYDSYLASGIADVITGGDVPGGTLITEEYLLELEREMFLKFCGQKKTLERIQHMLKKGRPLRN
ncbi:enoyl-CoA hydratase and 3-hydroxyacyl-CoA dehydrogenase [Citrifermentans bemidjiense Bem]|uniref:Enoyl-CoA hydratase and 3-hydroxyacyl-CoA dehydrogenase n=1 Tax=Citrifermentans bemidjiense (strain ATCC BAA-1014 / DSM 16622 / JCM 12645 / Bem) TaxID=404380 RepID=B5EDE3_CITBB|nr:3-hydroxyacyl-CoA dehydrogenase/enoyl-CoA hydratase family protein [Citrifermentans bemidjiense]ACH39139.1 enoyl-CoA hydratase and 3-hydroxyacyl-CoA dehydrogenase [Citrifermentans bemidjiense Bem]